MQQPESISRLFNIFSNKNYSLRHNNLDFEIAKPNYFMKEYKLFNPLKLVKGRMFAFGDKSVLSSKL